MSTVFIKIHPTSATRCLVYSVAWVSLNGKAARGPTARVNFGRTGEVNKSMNLSKVKENTWKSGNVMLYTSIDIPSPQFNGLLIRQSKYQYLINNSEYFNSCRNSSGEILRRCFAWVSFVLHTIFEKVPNIYSLGERKYYWKNCNRSTRQKSLKSSCVGFWVLNDYVIELNVNLVPATTPLWLYCQPTAEISAVSLMRELAPSEPICFIICNNEEIKNH